MRDVLQAAATYAPCKIVEADEDPPSTQPMPEPLRSAADVAVPAPPYQSQLRYRAVPPPPRPASPTPVVPFPAYGWQQPVPSSTNVGPSDDSQNQATDVKRHDSYYPVEVPIDGAHGVRESSMYPAATNAQARSAMAWALAGIAVFAIVLGFLMIADKARHSYSGSQLSAGARDSRPIAATELPTTPLESKAQPKPTSNTVIAAAAVHQDARGVDPADLPDSKGIDIATLPLAPVRPQHLRTSR